MMRTSVLLCALALAGCAAPLPSADQARSVAGGDGRSFESAIEIGRLSDAYLVLRDRGLVFQRHAVVRERDQPFDIITARRRRGGEERLVFSLIPDTAEDQAVARALRRLMTSGDGQGIATAFTARSVPQEEVVLRLLGLQRTQREVLREQGHLFDVVTAVDPADGTRRELFFRLPDEPTREAARRS